MQQLGVPFIWWRVIGNCERPPDAEKLEGEDVFSPLEFDEQLEPSLGLSPRVDGYGLQLLYGVWPVVEVTTLMALGNMGQENPGVVRVP